MVQAVGGAFQHGPGQLRRAVFTGQTDHLGPQVAVPPRRALALQIGKDGDARRPGRHRTCQGEQLVSITTGEVAQPFEHETVRRHRAADDVHAACGTRHRVHAGGPAPGVDGDGQAAGPATRVDTPSGLVGPRSPEREVGVLSPADNGGAGRHAPGSVGLADLLTGRPPRPVAFEIRVAGPARLTDVSSQGAEEPVPQLAHHHIGTELVAEHRTLGLVLLGRRERDAGGMPHGERHAARDRHRGGALAADGQRERSRHAEHGEGLFETRPPRLGFSPTRGPSGPTGERRARTGEHPALAAHRERARRPGADVDADDRGWKAQPPTRTRYTGEPAASSMASATSPSP